MVSASPKETYRSEQSSSDDKWTYGLQERSKSAHKTYVNPILVTNSWTRRPENLKTAEISRQEAPSECRHLTCKFKMVKYLRDWIQHLWLASGLLHFLVTSSISMAPLQNVSSKKNNNTGGQRWVTVWFFVSDASTRTTWRSALSRGSPKTRTNLWYA